MDSVRPWIIKKIKEGPLEHYKTIESQPTANVLPISPFRGQKVQFIKFLSSHEWGTHQPIWVEASDRQVTILVYLSSEIMKKFEEEQMADKREFSQLGYPTFFLGGCRWAISDSSHLNRDPIGKRNFLKQLCIKVISDIPNKKFKLGSTAAFPFPTVDNCERLVQFGHALRNEPDWILLNKRLQFTIDSRLSVTGDVESRNRTQGEEMNQGSNPSVPQIAIPHTGPSRRSRVLKARMLQKNSTVPSTKVHPVSIKDKPITRRTKQDKTENHSNLKSGISVLTSYQPIIQGEDCTHNPIEPVHQNESTHDPLLQSNSLLANESTSFHSINDDPQPVNQVKQVLSMENKSTAESHQDVQVDNLNNLKAGSGNVDPSLTENCNSNHQTDDVPAENVQVDVEMRNEPIFLKPLTELLTNQNQPIEIHHHQNAKEEFEINFSFDYHNYSQLVLPNDHNFQSVSSIPFNVKIKGPNLSKYFTNDWPVNSPYPPLD